MTITAEPRSARLVEDWVAHDPARHPLPADLLGSPQPFVSWLRRSPQRRFVRPTNGLHCPLAGFLRDESQMSWASVDYMFATWSPPVDWLPLTQDGMCHMALPGWAQRFVAFWDVWCALRSIALCEAWWGCPSTREARVIAWLAAASPRRLLRRLRHGQEAIP